MAETRLRVLDRAELPVDTGRLARFLIGKMLRAGAGRRRRERPHRRDRGAMASATPLGTPPRHDPAQSVAVPRARARLCLSRLWQLIHAQRLERNARRRRRRPDQGDRADQRHWDDAAKSRHRKGARPGARPGTAVRSPGSHRGLDESTFAGTVRCAWATTVRVSGEMGRADGSASHARQRASCDSTLAGIASSAARGRSTDERFRRRSSPSRVWMPRASTRMPQAASGSRSRQTAVRGRDSFRRSSVAWSARPIHPRIGHHFSTHGRSTISNAQVERCWRCSCR